MSRIKQRIKKVIHLGNVVENYIKGFTIFIKTSMLSSEFREDLVNIVRHNTGSVPLTMFLEDPVTNYKIEFLSRKFKISVNMPFIDDLKGMNIPYKVITK